MKTFFCTILGISAITFLLSCNIHEKDYLITASISLQGVDAGMKILEEGGTAMDAALSVALSEIAETHGKYISYAGLINLVYYEASTGKLYNMNVSYNTPKNETNPSTIPISPFFENIDNSNDSIYGRTILVPGFIKGIKEAYKKFGKVPFSRLFDNAIKIAEEGVIWNQEDEHEFKLLKKFLFKHPETVKIFTKSDGSFYEEGDTFKQPDLANTLRIVSEKGTEYMYTREWGRKFINAAQKMGGKISMEDMENYEVTWSEPVHGTYRGYDIYFHTQYRRV